MPLRLLIIMTVASGLIGVCPAIAQNTAASAVTSLSYSWTMICREISCSSVRLTCRSSPVEPNMAA